MSKLEDISQTYLGIYINTRISKDSSAEMAVFQHDNIQGDLIGFVKNIVVQIILGASNNPTKDENIYHYLKDKLIRIDIIVFTLKVF